MKKQYSLILFGLALILGVPSADFIDLTKASNMTVYDKAIVNTQTIKTTIGDSKSLVFKPKVEFLWLNTTEFSIGYPELNQLQSSVESKTSLLTYDRAGYSVIFYPLPDRDGLEFELILKNYPTTNYFEFDLDNIDGLVFEYQPELTEDEIKEGAIRPENVVGSYAVFSNRYINNQYTTGKVMHIYRPLIRDARNNTVYGTLNINVTTKKLRITIPILWLASATYPVSVDPTFGYTNVGGTALDSATNANGHKLNSTVQLISAKGIERVISLHAYGADASTAFSIGLYNTTQGATNTPNGRFAFTSKLSLAAGAAWVYQNVSYDLIAGQVYTTAIGNYTGSPKSYYDTVTNNTNSRSTNNTLTPKWEETGNINRVFSMYATYINVPDYFINITSPLNNTAYIDSTNFDLNFTIYGQASTYFVNYSLDHGVNTTIGIVANGTNNRTNIGTLSAGLHNITVTVFNESSVNVSYVNFSVYSSGAATISYTVYTLGGGSNSTGSDIEEPYPYTEAYYFNASGCTGVNCLYRMWVYPCANPDGTTNCQQGMYKPLYRIVNTGSVNIKFYMKLDWASPPTDVKVCANSSGEAGVTGTQSTCDVGNLNNSAWMQAASAIPAGKYLNITVYANYSGLLGNIIRQTNNILNSTA